MLNHKFKRLIRKNGMRVIRFHDLRHSTVSYLLKLGVSLKERQVWLGYSDISTTANFYTHMDLEMKENTACLIEERFGKNVVRKVLGEYEKFSVKNRSSMVK